MKASTWKGGTLGIRVGRENARKYFDPAWDVIEVLVEGKPHHFKLSKTFWTTCPEIRGGEIAAWLKRQGLDTWPNQRPHSVTLTPVRDNRFALVR